MAAAIGFLLAGVQFLIWLKLRARVEFLFAAIMSFAAGVAALCEAGFLGHPTAEQLQFRFEVQNIAVGFILISMVWYAQTRLGHGRRWLAVLITALWVVNMVVSIASPGNLTFLSIDSVSYLTTPWGEPFGMAEGTLHPMKGMADLASLAILVFVVDASISAFRAGHRRRAIRTGGAIVVFILLAGIHTPLVDAGLVRTPFVISLAFVAICLALALDLADDVVQSVRLNQDILIERQRWNALTQNVDLAVIRVDTHGDIAYANPFVQRIAGRGGDDMRGRPVTALMAGGVEPLLHDPGDGNAVRTTRSRVRRRLITPQGDQRDIVWFSVSLRTTTGDPDGYISFGQDITDQLQAEEESLTTRRDIERLTRAVALGELSSSLAHELSQPIAAILSNTQTLQIMRDRAGIPADETDEVLTDIFDDSRRARDLMQKVRGFMFNQAPEVGQFDLSAAAGEVIAMLAYEAEKNDVVLQTPPADAPFPVFAARIEIQQVLMNLVLNAIQSLHSSGRQGRVALSWSVTAKGEVEIRVDDDGPGLSADMMGSVFEPFVTTKASGTGIGLAVSKRIVERHKGRIFAAKSDLGGARFSVILPIIEQERLAKHA